MNANLLSVVALSSTVLTGCTPVEVPAIPAEPSGIPVELSDSQISFIQNEVRNNLKDPESARFAQIAAVREPEGILLVCGFVNGRNSFGGYTGFQPFSGIYTELGQLGSTLSIINIGGTDSQQMATLSVCRDSGVIL